jgi:hypothetical protein
VNRNLGSARKNRAGTFFATSLFIAGLSYVIVVLSVHTYCENRPYAGALAFVALVNAFVLLRSWPSTGLGRALSISGIGICSLAVAANVWFIMWATHACRHMFGLLNK